MLRHGTSEACPREAADTMLPRKASKLQLCDDRTDNGHTWAG